MTFTTVSGQKDKQSTVKLLIIITFTKKCMKSKMCGLHFFN